MTNTSELFVQIARGARAGQRKLAAASPDLRSTVLREIARLLLDRRVELLDANRLDREQAARDGVAAAHMARLTLDDNKLETLKAGLEALASSDDPVGRPLRRMLLDEGLELTQVASPLGVLLVIFESRPDAVIQIGGLAVRSGNGVILKGGTEAARSNAALVGCLRDALAAHGLDPDAVQAVQGRDDVYRLLELDSDIDLVIPRGSGSLVRSIRASTKIPVLGHADGVCMVYVDRAADAETTRRVLVDGKCDYPAACNATETVLVHREAVDVFRPAAEALRAAGVEIRADDVLRDRMPWMNRAQEQDGRVEYGALILAARTVCSIDEAIAYINGNGSAHTDAIVTQDEQAAGRFLREVDSASVFHNASTRMADGFRYGLGAEVGISTSRIHARGPVGVDGLMTTRWLLRGHGQGASDYGPGKRAFLHKRLS